MVEISGAVVPSRCHRPASYLATFSAGVWFRLLFHPPLPAVQHRRPLRHRDGGAASRGRRSGDGRRWEAVDLPTDREIELLVEKGSRLYGRYLLTAGPGTRPPLSDRRLAVTLADQVGPAPG